MTDSSDTLVGRNLAALRGRSLSQKALADAMRERGHRWSQATVWSIEKGERPLRYVEASELAEIFDVPMAALGESTAEVQLETDLANARRARSVLEIAAARYTDALMAVAFSADEAYAGQGEAPTIAGYLRESVGQCAALASSSHASRMASEYIKDSADFRAGSGSDRTTEELEQEAYDEYFSSEAPHRAALWEAVHRDVEYSQAP